MGADVDNEWARSILPLCQADFAPAPTGNDVRFAGDIECSLKKIDPPPRERRSKRSFALAREEQLEALFSAPASSQSASELCNKFALGLPGPVSDQRAMLRGLGQLAPANEVIDCLDLFSRTWWQIV